MNSDKPVMNNLLDDLDETLSINEMVVYDPPSLPEKTDESALSDIEYARVSIEHTIKQSNVALKALVEYVNSSPSPRSFEVLANLIKTNVEASKELVALHKLVKDINNKPNDPVQKAETINNVQMNFTTSDIIDMMKNAMSSAKS